MNGLNLSRVLLDTGWLFFLIFLFYHFWQDRQTLSKAQSWLKTKGRITQCEWMKQGHNLWPKIEYTYQVYERDLIGHYLFLDTSHNNPNSRYSRRVAYKMAMAFKEETEIDVYYNPNNPEQSALDVTMPWKLNLIILLVGLFLALHVIIILLHVTGLL
ncbi:MAG TPA: DUF3592 domain-containing protein [Legionella sp.]|nr:DUF3592 domain-containing protein [Legionella sp.]